VTGRAGELFEDAVEESADDMGLQVVADTAHAGTKQQVHVLGCVHCTVHDLAQQQCMCSRLKKLRLRLLSVPQFFEDMPTVHRKLEGKVSQINESTSVNAVQEC